MFTVFYEEMNISQLGAAWAFWHSISSDEKREIEEAWDVNEKLENKLPLFVSMGFEIKFIKDRDVYLLDKLYDETVMKQIVENAKSVTILSTTKLDLKYGTVVVYEEGKSLCRTTWDYLMTHREYPTLLQHFDKRDIDEKSQNIVISMIHRNMMNFKGFDKIFVRELIDDNTSWCDEFAQ
jgi:hypothetical protein